VPVAAVTPENRTLDRLSGPRCKAIAREVNRLCGEVRQCAGELVAAFAILEDVFGASIGLRDASAARR
jgi:hypothetical protein